MTTNEELILKALSQYGVKEIAGAAHNHIILEYFKASGHEWVKDDETAWCSAFVNWVAIQCGCTNTKKLNARSWLNVGEVVEEPKQGDVVVFWRIKKESAYGHVAFYIGGNSAVVYVLGGNQSNMITISSYPKSQVLGYRKLNKL